LILLAPALVHQRSGLTLGRERTEVRRLQDRAQRPLRSHRVLSDEVPVPDDHAAEILRPGAVDGAVDDHVPELLCARLLRHWRKRHEGIDLALGEERSAVAHAIRYPYPVAIPPPI